MCNLAVSNLRQASFESDPRGLESEGCGVLRIPMVREKSLPAATRSTGRRCRATRNLPAGIVHTHSSKGGALGRLLRSRRRRRARHTPHTFAFPFERDVPAWKRELFRDVETALAGHTQRRSPVPRASPTIAARRRRSRADPRRPNRSDPAP